MKKIVVIVLISAALGFFVWRSCNPKTPDSDVPKNFMYWYEKAEKQGDATVQNNLGVCYYNGDGVKTDYDQAVYCFKKSGGTRKCQCTI
ncbi:hypothetical protein FACS189451_10170 [Bacteroidia bacterium]|nr:hypothetical protein FACS189451_10170 [Bacteroidia bacterium]